MLRGSIDRGLLPLLAGAKSVATSAASQHAPAVASAPSSSLFGIFGSSRVSVPLSSPLSGVVAPTPDTTPTTAPALATSTLPSGATLATIPAPGPIATVSLVLPAGSSSETPATAGAAYLLPHLAFKSTTNRSTFRLVRELEKFGAIPSATSTRESLVYTLTFPKLFVPEAVEILLDAVLNPRLNPWEVAETAHDLPPPAPSAFLSEILHRAAYDGALGLPYLPSPSALAALTPAALAAFLSAAGPPVLASAGVTHEVLASVATPLLGASSAAPSAPASTYIGGAVNSIVDSPVSHVALAFEAKGGLSAPKTAATVAVLSALLDAQKEYIPYQHKQVEGANSLASLAHLYKSTGLIGLVGSIGAGQTSALLDIITHRLHALAKGVAPAELAAAKGAVVGAYLASTQGKAGLVQDIGSQLVNTGKFDQAAYVSQVSSLTEQDVSGFLAAALKTPATVVTHGSLAGLPRYQEVSRRFS